MHRILLIALLAAVQAALPAAAQWPVVSETDTTAVLMVAISADDAPEPGTRPAARLRGTMYRIASDTLYLRSPGDSLLAVPRIRILRVEESLGVSRRQSAKQLGYNLGVLGAVALMGWNDETGRMGSTERAVAIGGAVGVAVGVLWGAVLPYERKATVWLPEVPER